MKNQYLIQSKEFEPFTNLFLFVRTKQIEAKKNND